jgi:hypothetical protein
MGTLKIWKDLSSVNSEQWEKYKCIIINFYVKFFKFLAKKQFAKIKHFK